MPNIALLSAAHIHTRGYLKAISVKPGCKLAGIWDDVPDRGRRYAGEYGAPFECDLRKLIRRKDVDALLICSENTRHLPLLKAAIPAGKPIFCEKPFVTRAAEARTAMRLIRKHGTVVHMGYTMPFEAKMQGVAKLLADGALGTVTHVRMRNSHNAAYGRWFDSPDLRWFTDPDLAGGGAFMDLGTHAVHLVRTLMGPVKRVFATIGCVSGAYPRVDDFGVALFEFASGVKGVVEASWVQNAGIGSFEIAGSKSTLLDMPGKGLVTAAPKTEPVPVPLGESRPSRVDRLVAAVEGTITRRELDDDLAAAADAVAIMEACYKSARLGRWVDVPTV
jgi:predicted dehydrogenase